MNKSMVSALILVVGLGGVLAACSKAPEPATGQQAASTAPAAPAPTQAAPPPVAATTETVATVEAVAPVETAATVEAIADASEPDSTAEAATTEATPAVSAEPQTHIVKGVVTQWQPLVLFANPGDRVTFTNMTGHDTQSIDGLIPEGADPWQSKLGEEAYTITLPVAGAYVYKCNPHITTGMVGVMIVGDPAAVDLDQLLEAAGGIKVGRNMVQRAIRKAKKALPGS